MRQLSNARLTFESRLQIGEHRPVNTYCGTFALHLPRSSGHNIRIYIFKTYFKDWYRLA